MGRAARTDGGDGRGQPRRRARARVDRQDHRQLPRHPQLGADRRRPVDRYRLAAVVRVVQRHSATGADDGRSRRTGRRRKLPRTDRIERHGRTGAAVARVRFATVGLAREERHRRLRQQPVTVPAGSGAGKRGAGREGVVVASAARTAAARNLEPARSGIPRSRQRRADGIGRGCRRAACERVGADRGRRAGCGRASDHWRAFRHRIRRRFANDEFRASARPGARARRAGWPCATGGRAGFRCRRARADAGQRTGRAWRGEPAPGPAVGGGRARPDASHARGRR